MTLTPPTVTPAVLVDYRPVTDITPFTHRAGMTYQQLLENLRDYATRYLPSYLADEFAAVNEYIGDESAANAQRIADALTAISTAQIQITDPAILAVLNTASATLTKLNTLFAPASLTTRVQTIERNRVAAPSGSDDTATLVEAFNWSQSTGGTIELAAGTYKLTGYASQDLIAQPRIRGRGKAHTKLNYTGTTNGSTFLKFRGSSGTTGDGALTDLAIEGSDTATGVVALELAGVNGFDFSRIAIEAASIANPIAEGVRFRNELNGRFTEFCVGHDVSLGYYLTTAIRYMTDSGVDSFHGSGIDGNSVVNQSGNVNATHGRVVIDAGAKPYSAPMSATFFMTRTEMPVIENHSGLAPNFYGDMRVETQLSGGGFVSVGTGVAGTPPVYHAGTVSQAGDVRLGTLYEVERIGLNGANVGQVFKPRSWNYTGANGTTQVVDAICLSEGMNLVAIEIVATNYFYSAMLAVFKSVIDGSGQAQVIGTPVVSNPGSVTAPTFTVSSGTLYVNSAAANYEVRAHLTPGFSYLR